MLWSIPRHKSKGCLSSITRSPLEILVWAKATAFRVWCVNAPAVDVNGTVYANSEDGNVYVIGQQGFLQSQLFLNLAIGAAYTPISLGPDGKIYTQNDGHLFVIGN